MLSTPMKKLFLISVIALVLFSCAPGKSSKQYRVDVYCNSCHVKIGNEWSHEDSYVIETPFDGIVTGYKSILFNKFDSPNSCVRVREYTNYTNDTITAYFIEDGDTLGYWEEGWEPFCN